MAHYAFLNEYNIVTEVIVGNDGGPIDWEQLYSKERGKSCKKTSYNTLGGKHITNGTPLRKNYAGIGYKYDPTRDAFIPPKQYNSWVLNEETCLWIAPVEKPNDGKVYRWVEEQRSWVAL
jgi:hypothetical protein